MTQKLLRLRAVEDATGLKRSTLYRLIQSNDFPPPIQLTGARAVAWVQSDVENWIQARIANAKSRGEVRQ